GANTNWQLRSVPDLILLGQSTTETSMSAFLVATEQLARLGPNDVVELRDTTAEHVIATIDAKLPHQINGMIALNDGKFIAAYSYRGDAALIEVAKRSV